LTAGLAWSGRAAIWNGDGHDGQLGDEAYSAGDYGMSVKFYQRWLDNAEDKATRREAALRLTDALLRFGERRRAVALLTELHRQYPGAADPDLMILDAEVNLTDGKADAARLAMEKLLGQNNLNENLRWQATELLGRSLMAMQNWNEAGKVFAMLERAAAGTKWEYIGFCKRAYSLIMTGKVLEAGQMLSANLKYSDLDSRTEIRTLSLLLLAKEQRYDEFKDAYRMLRQNLEPRPDPLLYQALKEAFNHFLTTKEYPVALNYLSEAVAFAPDSETRNQTFRTIINTALAAGKPAEALAAGDKFLNFNRGAADENIIVMEVAALNAAQKRIDAAVRLYFSLVDDHTRALNVRIEAARAAGNLLAAERRFPEAEKAFDFICRNGTDNAQQAEGFMLLGKLYFNQEFYLRAAELFLRVGELSANLRGEALYWAMRAYIELKEYDQALETMEKLKRLDALPEWVRSELFYYAGIISQATGHNDAACEMLINYAKLFPDAEHAPEALFRASDIAMAARKYQQAAAIYQSFVTRYPHHASAPAALYRLLRAMFLSGNNQQAIAAAAQMQKDYPDSSYTPSAMFWLVDYYRDAGEYRKALDVLNQLTFKYGADKEALAEALRDTAIVCRRLSDDEQAKAALNRMVHDLPESKLVGEAYFMLGDIASDAGDYENAVNDYKQCQKQHPVPPLSWAVAGRLADCNYSLYTRNGEDKNITQSIDEYADLLKTKELPIAIREQTLFKLGKCYEARKESNPALELYMEIIYNYAREAADPNRPRRNPVWVVNAAQAAIDIYLKVNNAGAAQAAINIYRMMEKMQINTGENFKSRIEVIRRRYNMK